MIAIDIIFMDGQTIKVYSDTPDVFAQSIADAQVPEILEIHYDKDKDETPSNLDDFSVTLVSGKQIICRTTEDQINKAMNIEGISSTEKTYVLKYAKLQMEEDALDSRYNAARSIINNIPNLDLRVQAHREYIKRKRGYVAALESVVEGLFRRPE